MDHLTKGKLVKGNLSITGSSSAKGGTYEQVRIIGEVTIDGDVRCKRLKCMGTMDMDGSLWSGQISVIGTCVLSGDCRTNSLQLSGTVTIGGDASCQNFRCAGTMETRGNLYADRLSLKGQLNTKGDCEAEVFSARGIFDIGGLLNAGKLDVKLYRDCSAKEIGGGKIRVRTPSLLNPFSFFFKPSSSARLSAFVIEGDEIYLENTKAKVVRGNRVVIGRGCEIELVEYKEHFGQNKAAIINEKRKV